MKPIARRALLLVTAAAAALSATGCNPFALSPSAAVETSPAIAGTRIVWEDSRNDPPDGTDVFMFDTGTITQSLVAGGAGDQGEPAVSDRYVVWSDGGRLEAKDLSSGQVFSVTNGPADQGDPALCGSVVVWSDGSNNSDVYARDLADPQSREIPVATSSATEAYPACDAGRVVYMYAPAGQFSSIRLYDIASGQTKEVSNQAWNDWRPVISGDRVVWQGWPNQPDTTAGIQIFGTNLDTGQDFVVTSGPNHQVAPAISGSVVAWEDWRSGEPRVWWRDLGTAMDEQQVAATQPGTQRAPALSGRALVYEGNSSGVSNIYETALTNP
jgi:beta propeller repeat protein